MTETVGTRSRTDVLIVGAGPAGLTMANLLARYRLDFRIVDKGSGPTDQSRALVVHARTLELWDKLGLADEALRRGQKFEEVYPLINGRPLASGLPILPLKEGGKGVTPYPFALVFEQSKTERLLLDSLEGLGTSVEWDTELLGLTPSENGATGIVRGPSGSEEEICAGWVVGADGANSPVRHSLGLSFEGSTYKQSFFLADMEMRWDLGHDRFYLDLVREGMYSFFPMYGGDRFRLVATTPPEMEGKEKITHADIQKVLDEHSGLDVQITSVRWASVYKVHRRMTERFRVGRIFLAGDAAHIHSPSGGQGMNTGIGDAFNLAWKLALVAKGEAHPVLLDSYETERMPVARTILNGTDRAFELQSTAKPFLKSARLWVIRYAPTLQAKLGLSELIFKFISQIWIRYRKSPAVAQSGYEFKGPKAGDRTPYGLLKNGTSLYDLLGNTDHHLLLFEGLSRDPKLAVKEEEIKNLHAQYGLPVGIHRIPSENRDLYERYGVKAPTLFLIRPDGHVAYRGRATDLRDFAKYLDGLFVRCKPGPPVSVLASDKKKGYTG
jgi:2-polyprenyl-6-methoxyphenol hydroxylase-like FAD-dependent oxidoreductase